MVELPFLMMRFSSAIPSPNVLSVLLFLLGMQLGICAPPESYPVHSCIGLGDVSSDHAGIDSQAYSGATAVDPNPTRELSAGTSNGQIRTPDPAVEQTQQEVRSPREQVTPTLPWSAKPLDITASASRSDQHPILPPPGKKSVQV